MGEQKKRRAGEARSRRANQRRQRNHYKQNKAGMLCISCIVLFLLVAMSTQIFRLYQKKEDLAVQEKQRMVQLENEQERQEEIKAYEEYVTMPEYIEQIAKTKLGLVYSNEIIFKEQKEEP